jgi:hypothetical protein
MRLNFFELALLTIGVGFSDDQLAYSKHEFAVPVITDHGDSFISGREAIIDVKSSNPNFQRADFVVLYDKRTSCFIWHLTPIFPRDTPSLSYWRSFSKGLFAYAGDQRIVLFSLSSPRIVVLASASTAESFDEAEQRSLVAARALLAEMSRPPEPGLREREDLKRLIFISFADLGQDFFAPPLSVVNGPLEILSVARRDDKWEVTIRGQWTERLIINSDFKIASKERIE